MVEIDKNTSDKLRVLSFIAAILVVVQHSFAHATFIQSLVTESLTRVAVPFFFIVSGFLLYKDFDFKASWALSKVRSRITTLLVPYLAWAIISMLLTPDKVDFSSLVGVLKSLGIINAAPLAAGHLWYIRTLFGFVVFASAIAFMIKYIRWGVPALAMGVYIVLGRSTMWSSLAWFSVGAMIALYYPEVFKVRSRRSYVACAFIAAVSLALLRTVVFKGELLNGDNLRMFTRATEALLVVVLLFALFFGFNYIQKWVCRGKVMRLAGCSFFLYCAHPYVYRLFPIEWSWGIRALCVLIVVGGGYMLLKNVMTKWFMQILTGGR